MPDAIVDDSDPSASDGSPPSLNPWRTAFLVFLAGIVGLQLLAVTLAAIPPNSVSNAAAPSTDYLRPYFTQNWRLFAPNPVAQDRTVRFQASYRDEAGDVQQTAWVDWTAVELDLVHHRIVGGRGGYVTNKLIESLSAVYRPMNEDQRSIINSTRDDAPLGWADIESQLVTAGVAEPRLASFLRYERATVRLGTDVLRARHPDLDLVAVRYGVGLHDVTPFDQRSQGADARPNPTERLSGWRPPVRGSQSELQAIADFDARHR